MSDEFYGEQTSLASHQTFELLSSLFLLCQQNLKYGIEFNVVKLPRHEDQPTARQGGETLYDILT